jgi:hypothetical protein
VSGAHARAWYKLLPKNSLFLVVDFYYRLSMTMGEPLETIEQLADAVRRRQMVAPAIFMLELCKPFTGCLRELHTTTESLQSLLFGRELLPGLKTLLLSVENIERLICLLERDSSKEVQAL